MERLTFTVKDKNGKEFTLEGIATYHDNDLNKDFIVYTDMTYDDEGKLRVYFSLYKKVNDKIELIDITTAEEKKIGLQLVRDIVERIIGC